MELPVNIDIGRLHTVGLSIMNVELNFDRAESDNRAQSWTWFHKSWNHNAQMAEKRTRWQWTVGEYNKGLNWIPQL